MLILLLCLAIAIVLMLAFRVAILAFCVGLWYATIHLGLVQWVLSHPRQAVAYGCGYLVVGAAYSVLRWFLEEREKVQEAKRRYQAMPSTQTAQSWADYAKRHKTVVENHTSELFLWVAFWPFSGAWTLLHDPVTRIVRELRGVYQRITDSVWS